MTHHINEKHKTARTDIVNFTSSVLERISTRVHRGL